MKAMNTRTCATKAPATSKAKLANMVQTRGLIALGSSGVELPSGPRGSFMGWIVVRLYGFEIRRFLCPASLHLGCQIRSDPPPHHCWVRLRFRFTPLTDAARIPRRSCSRRRQIDTAATPLADRGTVSDQ